MKRRPTRDLYRPIPTDAGAPIQRTIATSDAQAVSAFLVSGGLPYFIVNEGPPYFDPRPAGVQLVCSVFIPRGRIGFLKSLRVAPFIAPPFSDPFAGGNTDFWREGESPLADGEPIRAMSQNGLWSTPLAWQSYANLAAEIPIAPEWYWHLRAIPGNIEDLRTDVNNIPPFTLGDTASWYLVPQIPVPAAVYASGIPGDSVGSPFDRQAVQVLPGDALALHIPIGENTTLALFAEWKQQPVNAYCRDDNGRKLITNQEFYPLLPSFGQLIGFTQPADRPASLQNALTWS